MVTISQPVMNITRLRPISSLALPSLFVDHVPHSKTDVVTFSGRPPAILISFNDNPGNGNGFSFLAALYLTGLTIKYY